jgi:hypothetical protein
MASQGALFIQAITPDVRAAGGSGPEGSGRLRVRGDGRGVGAGGSSRSPDRGWDGTEPTEVAFVVREDPGGRQAPQKGTSLRERPGESWRGYSRAANVSQDKLSGRVIHRCLDRRRTLRAFIGDAAVLVGSPVNEKCAPMGTVKQFAGALTSAAWVRNSKGGLCLRGLISGGRSTTCGLWPLFV